MFKRKKSLVKIYLDYEGKIQSVFYDDKKIIINIQPMTIEREYGEACNRIYPNDTCPFSYWLSKNKGENK